MLSKNKVIDVLDVCISRQEAGRKCIDCVNYGKDCIDAHVYALSTVQITTVKRVKEVEHAKRVENRDRFKQ